MKFFICLFALLFLLSTKTDAQEQILCPWIEIFFTIENEEDILNVITNSDGTLTLTHPTNQEITDIFSNYELSVFERTFPTAQSGALMKLYTLGANSKQLFADLRDNVSNEIYSGIEFIGIDTSINDDFITLVNGREFRLSGAISTTDLDTCTINCTPTPVPDNINIKIAFSHNPDTGLLTMETTEETSCGNSFSINLSGGFDNGNGDFNDFNLQTWSTISGTSSLVDFNEPCFQTELLFFSLLDLYCVPGVDDLSLNYKVVNMNPDGIFQLLKPNPFFGEDRLEFRDVLLSVSENTLENIYVYQIEGNPYLQINNPSNKALSVKMYDLTGREVASNLKTSPEIMISKLTSNVVYLIQLQDNTGSSKTIKFIKR